MHRCGAYTTARTRLDATQIALALGVARFPGTHGDHHVGRGHEQSIPRFAQKLSPGNILRRPNCLRLILIIFVFHISLSPPST